MTKINGTYMKILQFYVNMQFYDCDQIKHVLLYTNIIILYSFIHFDKCGLL